VTSRERVACPDCGLVQALPAIAEHEVARCVRCHRLLKVPEALSRASFALIVAALLLWIPGCLAPLMTVYAGGAARTTNLIGCAVKLWGTGYAPLGMLVLMLMLVIPSVFMLLLIIAQASRIYPPIRAERCRMWAQHLRPWLMTEVFVVGACVAYSRIQSVANVAIDAGGWCLAGSALLLLASLALLGEYSARPQWQSLESVERSGTASMHATAALVFAGLVLYIPANLLPVLQIESYGAITHSTILGGVVELVHYDLWPLAVIVFMASVVVPLAKLFGLSWLLWQTHRRSPRLLRQRTRMYRLIDTIGRWSNIDVFMISILSAVVQFGALTQVRPEQGALAFAAVVLITMIAARSFDPRVMWRTAAAPPPPVPT
jgi:paraquat-inducible protein A